MTFHADGRKIFKSPITMPREGGGVTIEIGFPILVVTEYVNEPEKVAAAVADALNKSGVFR